MSTIPMPSPSDIEVAAEARHLSIAAICRQADIDQTAFRRWKAGKGMPSLRTIQKMIDVIEAVPIPPAEAV
jgi:predicted transcriptional regulator